MKNEMRAGTVVLLLTQLLVGCDGAGPFRAPTSPSPLPIEQPIPQPPPAVKLLSFVEASTGFTDSGPARRPGADRADQLGQRAHLDRRWHAPGGVPGNDNAGIERPSGLHRGQDLPRRVGFRGSFRGQRWREARLLDGRLRPRQPRHARRRRGGGRGIGGHEDRDVCSWKLHPLRRGDGGDRRATTRRRRLGVPRDDHRMAIGDDRPQGAYRMAGMYVSSDEVAVLKDGYQDFKQVVTIRGDTHFDISVVRR